MVYQPKVRLRTRADRVEALVRWEDPCRIGLAVALRAARGKAWADRGTDAVGLRTTLRQWLRWREQGIDTCVAFNISALSSTSSISRPGRADVPRARRSDRLVVELTRARPALIKLMDTLTRSDQGDRIAIDDSAPAIRL